MDNSEKLSLFRKGDSNSIGLTDVPLMENTLPNLSLNKETISYLNTFQEYDIKATFSLWNCGNHSTKPNSNCKTGCQATCPKWSKVDQARTCQADCIKVK
jgi:DNA polymerase III psi subunit